MGPEIGYWNPEELTSAAPETATENADGQVRSEKTDNHTNAAALDAADAQPPEEVVEAEGTSEVSAEESDRLAKMEEIRNELDDIQQQQAADQVAAGEADELSPEQ